MQTQYSSTPSYSFDLEGVQVQASEKHLYLSAAGQPDAVVGVGFTGLLGPSDPGPEVSEAGRASDL